MTESYHSLESRLVALLLQDASRLTEVDLLSSEFENATAAQIYSAIMDVDRAMEPVDVVTVALRLEHDTGKNWTPTLGELVRNTPPGLNAQHYAGLIRESARKRQAAAIAERLQGEIDALGMDAIDAAVRDLMALNATRRNYEHGIKDVMQKTVEELDRVFSLDGELPGTPTGMADIDEKLGGLHPSDLIVVGARPAMGKTAWLVNVALRSPAAVGVISGEQGSEQIGQRLIAMEGRVSVHAMRNGRIEDEQWPRITDAVGKLTDRRIWINDKPAPSLEDIVRQARKWRHEHGISLLCIDYLQKIRSTHQQLKRHEQVGQIVQGLKELARELQIPVLVLGQVNRQVEQRSDKRPGLADLLESGAIEQEADQIAMLYRDEVYHPDSPDHGIAEFNIVKNRHGPTGRLRLTWVEEFMRFENFIHRDQWAGPQSAA